MKLTAVGTKTFALKIIFIKTYLSVLLIKIIDFETIKAINHIKSPNSHNLYITQT